MTKPKRIDLSQKELDALIERVEAGTLLDSDREIIKAMADTISLLSHAVDDKTASIKRLLKMIFGSSTEKTASILKNQDKIKSSPDDDTKSGSPDKKKPKGHGRNGAASYSGADNVKTPHDTLEPKSNCPVSRASCMRSKRQKQWSGLQDKAPFMPRFLKCRNSDAIFVAKFLRQRNLRVLEKKNMMRNQGR